MPFPIALNHLNNCELLFASEDFINLCFSQKAVGKLILSLPFTAGFSVIRYLSRPRLRDYKLQED
jgi:hypothetical protein